MSAADKAPKSNIEMVTELMHFSPVGAVSQWFIIDAIYKQACAVSALDPAMLPPNPFVSNEAWVNAARDIRTRMGAHYAGVGRIPPGSVDRPS